MMVPNYRDLYSKYQMSLLRELEGSTIYMSKLPGYKKDDPLGVFPIKPFGADQRAQVRVAVAFNKDLDICLEISVSLIVNIDWVIDLGSYKQPLTDTFSKLEFEKFLEEHHASLSSHKIWELLKERNQELIRALQKEITEAKKNLRRIK